MADVVPCEILFRLRHPKHEADKLSTYHASIQEWAVDMDGKAVPLPERGPFPPAVLDKMGFPLDDLMQAVAVAALRDHELMRVQMETAVAEKTAKIQAAQDERDAAVAAMKEAVKSRDAAIAQKEAADLTIQTTAEDLMAARTEAQSLAKDKEAAVARASTAEASLSSLSVEHSTLVESFSKLASAFAEKAGEVKTAVDPT